jgi:hypothetical protein
MSPARAPAGLAEAIRQAAARVRLTVEMPNGPGLVLRFGTQLDTQTVNGGPTGELTPEHAARYIANRLGCRVRHRCYTTATPRAKNGQRNHRTQQHRAWSQVAEAEGFEPPGGCSPLAFKLQSEASAAGYCAGRQSGAVQ